MATAGSRGDGLVLRRHWARDETWLEVMHARPRALFSGSLLRALRRGEGMPEVGINEPVAVGAVVRIRARNQMLVYRLVAHDEQWDVYTGEWPD